jgi:hypothetical protein
VTVVVAVMVTVVVAVMVTVIVTVMVTVVVAVVVAVIVTVMVTVVVAVMVPVMATIVGAETSADLTAMPVPGVNHSGTGIAAPEIFCNPSGLLDFLNELPGSFCE